MALQRLSPQEKAQINDLLEVYKYRWSLHAREKQRIPEGEWVYWLIKAGRGFGKTRTGSETVRIWKEKNPIIHLVGATAADVRDIMVEGESGILNISPYWDKPYYEPSKKKLTWNNGSICKLFSADEPDRLRGPQCYKAWADELAAWRYEESWIQLKMGLRLGINPQCVITTTPRPTKIMKELVKDNNTHVTNGTSYENKENLADVFYDQIIKMYEGTRLGRQELNAELLEDIEGALWNMNLIDNTRINSHPELKKVVVTIDPAGTSNPESDETGIMAIGLGDNWHGYILEDLTGIYTPNQWAEKSVYLYNKWEADAIVPEVNFGKDLIESNLRTVSKNVSIVPVKAYKGKYLRAQPVASLYEQGKVHHVGCFSKLEDEMTTWEPTSGLKSPNRLDCMVYGLTYLMLDEHSLIFFG